MTSVIRYIVIHDDIFCLHKSESIDARHVIILLCIRIAQDKELITPACFKMLACELGLAVLLEGDLLSEAGRLVISFLILHRRRKARRRAYRNNRRSRLLPSREGSQEGLRRSCRQSA